MYMTECNVCYTDISYGIKCFERCSFIVCHNCFPNLLKLNNLDCVEYSCPMCRNTFVKNRDKRFARFLNNNKKCLKKIVQLYEVKFRQHTARIVATAWDEFHRQMSEEPDVFPLVAFDYDSLLPDN